MTTKSPAETFGQQAEAVSGKPMSWTGVAARLAPLAGAAAGIVGARKMYDQRQGRRDAHWLANQLEQNQVRADMIRQHQAGVQRINQRFHTIVNRNRVPTI